MSPENFSREEVLKLIAESQLLVKASVAYQIAERPFSVQVVQLDLGTAKTRAQAQRIGFQFKSIRVESATDVNANVQVIFGGNDALQSPTTMKQNDSLVLGQAVPEAYIYWTAQTGKTMTLVCFVDAEFRSGSQISVSGGGVSINDGTSVAATTRVTLAATTAAIIVPANTSRKNCLVQNNSGADLYLSGASSVTNTGATRGIKIPDGAIYEYRNTAALYGYSVAGGDTNYMDMS